MKHLSKKYQKKNGFSLLSVIVSLAIVAIIGLSLATFSASTTAYFSKMDQHTRINEAAEEMRNLLSNPFQCTKNFANKNFNPNTTAETAVTTILLYNESDLTTNESFLVNKDDRGVMISSISIVPGKNILDNKINAASLQIVFKSKSNVNDIERNIPIYILTSANKITSCWIKKPEGDAIGEQICAIASGETYDPIAKKCISTAKGVWHTGTSTEATCPRGTSMVQSKKRSKCSYQLADGWEDPQPKTSIPMTNGSTVVKVRSPARFSVDTENNTCHCSWANNIPDGDVSNFKCKVLCQ